MKNSIKKIIKIVVLILILLILLFFIYMIYINYDGKLDKTNQMSREEILELIEKGCKNQNFYCSISSNVNLASKVETQNKIELYFKNNIMKETVNGRDFEWVNYETNTRIGFWSFPHVTIGEYENSSNNNSSVTAVQYGFEYYPIVEIEEFDFDYLGEKEINGRTTILVNLKEKSNLGDIKYFIDKETGLIIKQYYYYTNIIPKRGYVERDDIKFDCVTDEDVKIPNIVGYNVEY